NVDKKVAPVTNQPSDEAELVSCMLSAQAIEHCASAFRYPRGEALGVEIPTKPRAWPIGKGRVIREGRTVAVLSFGARLQPLCEAADQLARGGISLTICDARFAKPLDEELLGDLVDSHNMLFTIEEGAIGGFSAQVLDVLVRKNWLSRIAFEPMYFPDYFIDHNNPDAQYEEAGLSPTKIAARILRDLENMERSSSKRVAGD
ncbi:MAG: transketolase C-terminal domain-containing protein, partial [Pseudomonadota bacterium]